MKTPHKLGLAAVAIIAAATLAACDNTPDGLPPAAAGTGNTTLSALVHSAFASTPTETALATALPIEINGLTIDNSSEDPTLFNDLLGA